MTQRFYIETWGCQMNELDTQRMAGQLVQQGFVAAREPAEADVILLNSCSVREKAEQKAYSRLGEYRRLKRENARLKIGFCGCVAEQEGRGALSRVAELDFVLGTGRIGEMSRVLDECRRTGRKMVATGFPDDRHYDIDNIARDGQYKGMITVIEGCNKKCTFCIVPTTRGTERSRPLEHVLAEVRHLVASGFREIELLGQTVNHWRQPGDPTVDFADLLDAVAAVPGVERLRFVTSYPRDFTLRMVERFARHPNLCPYLHLPVQSGSDRILRRMGRGYEISVYLGLVDALRAARPEIALSTDLIVGFPGETDQDFEATVQLVQRVRFASLFAFKYSPRPGTAALRLADPPVPPEVADARLQQLFEIQAPIQRELNERLVGEEVEVLVTGWSKQPGYLSGRTPCHRIVHFAGSPAPAPGSIVRVRATRAADHSLLAEPLTPGPA
ncbi:MAG TPA: tRNA (N6-isopentenyl adenosine(37)-C2)-methylthiotransferase MiaB [Thermoanaerobaculia bacterium]|nr:tRNA (N6-isopentenyl adenosine(37)-C2)-methylthiotransferase MiaB [Thermoanaerobaculia bacterium]